MKQSTALAHKPTETHKLLVGWRTRLVDNAEELMASVLAGLKAPANYKDEDKIKEYLAEAKAQIMVSAKDWPYLGTFDEVVIMDTGPGKRKGHWLHAERHYKGAGSKPPICVAVRTWLLERYKDAWPDDTNPGARKPEVIFLGFEPRGFLKLLGIECSLPWIAKPLPASMWYGNNEHRDITEACIPNEYRKLDWPTVFKVRGIVPKEDWRGPGADPVEDVRLIIELATQLGFAMVPPEYLTRK